MHPRSFPLLAAVLLGVLAGGAYAADTDGMLTQCRARAAKSLGASPDDVAVKYEGQRTDKTHAVNGSASVNGQERTFQCSFDRSGQRIAKFIVNKPTAAAASPGDDEKEADATRRAGAGQFDARGRIPCAQAKGQPMGQCDFGVARAGGGSGTATVVVSLPDGRQRALFFRKFKAVGADLSQADGDMSFRAGKENDLYLIRAGRERYEIPEAVITGG